MKTPGNDSWHDDGTELKPGGFYELRDTGHAIGLAVNPADSSTDVGESSQRSLV